MYELTNTARMTNNIARYGHWAMLSAKYGDYGNAIAWANMLPRNMYRAALVTMIRASYSAYEQRERFARFDRDVSIYKTLANQRRACRQCGKMTDATYNRSYEYCTSDCEREWWQDAELAFDALLEL